MTRFPKDTWSWMLVSPHGKTLFVWIPWPRILFVQPKRGCFFGHTVLKIPASALHCSSDTVMLKIDICFLAQFEKLVLSLRSPRGGDLHALVQDGGGWPWPFEGSVCHKYLWAGPDSTRPLHSINKHCYSPSVQAVTRLPQTATFVKD